MFKDDWERAKEKAREDFTPFGAVCNLITVVMGFANILLPIILKMNGTLDYPWHLVIMLSILIAWVINQAMALINPSN